MSPVTALLDAFAEISDKVVYRDIRHDDFWAEMLDAYRQPGETRKQFIWGWIDEERQRVYEEISDAEEVGDSLVVYRCLSIDNPDKFVFMTKRGLLDPEFSGLGVFWSWDIQTADCHWGTGIGDLYIQARVPLSSINIRDTFLANMQPVTGVSEKEIRLKGGAEVGVVDFAWKNREGPGFQWAEYADDVMAILPA